ncbi:hypothetical protein [Elusimicrobium posterum]|uniref:hypothetical protein n=1 Tax=Elusimicrobium posterum TaxID=3116653 RepID=UPI003C765738
MSDLKEFFLRMDIRELAEPLVGVGINPKTLEVLKKQFEEKTSVSCAAGSELTSIFGLKLYPDETVPVDSLIKVFESDLPYKPYREKLFEIYTLTRERFAQEYYCEPIETGCFNCSLQAGRMPCRYLWALQNGRCHFWRNEDFKNEDKKI